MRKHRKLLIALACLAVVAAGIAFATRVNEPEYEGCRLSEWLERSSGEDAAATNALRRIGTNALPCLIEWMQVGDNPWRGRLAAAFKKGPGSRWTESLNSKLFAQQSQLDLRANWSASAFHIIGAQAAMAIPQLEGLANPPHARDTMLRALEALAGIGTNSFPVILDVLRDPQHPYRDMAAAYIGGMSDLGTNASQAVPILVERLGDPRPVVAEFAADALGHMAIDPSLVVPALAKSLQHENQYVRCSCATALGNFGTNARSACSALTSLLGDSYPIARQKATNALLRIAPELLTNTPAK